MQGAGRGKMTQLLPHSQNKSSSSKVILLMMLKLNCTIQHDFIFLCMSTTESVSAVNSIKING
jgi:hypothetical protein